MNPGAPLQPAAAAAAAVPSLRRRLSRFVLLLAAIWMGVTTVGLAVWLHHEVNELLDDGLVATSEALAVVLQSEAITPMVIAAAAGDTARSPVPLASDADDLPFAWQLLDAEGRVLLRSASAPRERLLLPPAPGGSAAAATRGAARLGNGGAAGAWRVRMRPLAQGRWLLVAQQASERFEAALEVATGTIGVALLATLLLLAWLRRRLARETQPLADLSDVLARYDPLHRAAPLPPPALQELAPVHEAVQQMGERLAANAAAERAFSAHAAHALRTPLAGLEAQLAVAQREAPAALQGRLARMRGATTRLSHVVTALLALFRSGGELKRSPVDVEALLARVPLEGLVLEIVRPAGAGPGARLPRPLADADLLAAALINLLDNAVRHGARRVRVQVHEAHITLADDGPGVSADRLAHLRQALALDDVAAAAAEAEPAATGSPASGTSDQALTGLGLALADRVARVHGGRLELLTAEAGFAVRLWLADAGRGAAALADAAPRLAEQT
ncbi:MAG: HAMP domain-containing histidine kinase [Rubrivivax sp.]|nr:HAMP domain-containing histidine kinase [Rubrivivax sp.]